MESILEWFRTNNDVFGFGVATLIFLVTIILVSRQMIGFWITMLFLFFALFSGLIIANQDFVKKWMMKDPINRETSPEIEAYHSAQNKEQYSTLKE